MVVPPLSLGGSVRGVLSSPQDPADVSVRDDLGMLQGRASSRTPLGTDHRMGDYVDVTLVDAEGRPRPQYTIQVRASKLSDSHVREISSAYTLHVSLPIPNLP